MINAMKTIFLTTITLFGWNQAFAAASYPFALQQDCSTLLEGYFTPPSSNDAPLIVAIQGSTCQSVFSWHQHLCEQMSSLGLGVIALEKKGISQSGIDMLTYNQTNCLEQRIEDYTLCLANLETMFPGWKGKIIFWGESEGGMIATYLASKTPQTAALLLFGAGCGMRPREEVKWALRHRLGQQTTPEAINAYMSCLEEQLDLMMNDPAVDKQFLGNTYKWWASLLNAEAAALSLTQQSLPILLIHGAEDAQIPVQSSDLASQLFSQTNDLTYLRLEGYGHDLDAHEIQEAAYYWLESILSHQTTPNDIYVDPNNSISSSENTTTDDSDFVFNRGKDKDKSNGSPPGQVGISGSASTDSHGQKEYSAEGEIKYRFNNGLELQGKVGVSGGTDKKGEAHVEGRISKPF